MEKTWLQRLEEAKKEGRRETAEVICQTEECEAASEAITAEELDYRLNAQKQQLQVEADKVKHKAVEEARKQTQRELHEKHLDDMTKQVSAFIIINSEQKCFCVYFYEKQQVELNVSCLYRVLFISFSPSLIDMLYLVSLNVILLQVEGAVTRAYNRWVEDLTSLPEYQASLQSERKKWAESHEQLAQQRV